MLMKYNTNTLYVCFPVNKTLLYTEEGYNYYKVPVADGQRLVEGKVPETCAKAGLRALCSGPEGCSWDDTENCLATPLSTDCTGPMSVSNQRCYFAY